MCDIIYKLEPVKNELASNSSNDFTVSIYGHTTYRHPKNYKRISDPECYNFPDQIHSGDHQHGHLFFYDQPRVVQVADNGHFDIVTCIDLPRLCHQKRLWWHKYS